MFTRVLQNLGIVSDVNLKKQNPDLAQGIEFIHYNKKITVRAAKRLPYLQVSSIPGLQSINEAMNGKDSVNGNNRVNGNNTVNGDTILILNKNINSDITQNENDFNKLLSEYGTLQQNLEDSKLYHNVDKQATALIIKKLAILNEKLIKHAKKINDDMSNLHVSDDTLKHHITKQQTSLNKYIQELAQQKEDMVTVNGMEENTKLIRTSNKYYYVMWFFLLITLLALFMYILTSDLVMNTIIVIICLMVIYILAREIHYKYM